MRNNWIYGIFFIIFLLPLNLFSQNKLFIETIESEPYDDVGEYVVETPQDRGYLITGYTSSFGAGLYDVLLTKLDSTGAYEWSKVIGGSSNDEGVYSVKDRDGGYVVIGNTESFGAGSWDIFIVKFDSLWNLEWAKTIGGTGGDRVNSVIKTADSGYVMSVFSSSFNANGSDILVIKFDSLWNIEWSKMIVVGSYDDQALSVIQTFDMGYALTGYLRNPDNTTDILFIKIDSVGNLEWAKQYYEYNGDDIGYSLLQLNDSGYIIVGYTGSGMGLRDAFIARITSSGDIRWFKTLGEELYDRAEEVVKIENNKYAMIGDVQNTADFNWHLFISEFDDSGNHLETRIFYRTNYNDIPVSITKLNNGRYTITGGTYPIGSMYNILFMLLGSQLNGCMLVPASLPILEGYLTVSDISPVVSSVSPIVHSVYPQINDAYLNSNFVCELQSSEHFEKAFKIPDIIYFSSFFRNKIRIDFSSSSNNPLKIELYDVKGTPVYKKSYEYTPQILIIDEQRIKGLKPGTYFLSVYNNNLKCSEKMKIIKLGTEVAK